MTEQTGTARKVTMPQARKAYRVGAVVIVTERPEGDVIPVYRMTTTNSNRNGRTWEQLHQDVMDWRSRYPRQTFYVVETA